MIPGLKAGKFDVIMDGMSITDERKKEIDFTEALRRRRPPPSWRRRTARRQGARQRQGGQRAKDKAAGDAAIKEVKAALKGKTIGVQVSTTHANFASKYLKDVATVKEYKTTDERDLDLKAGRIDVGARRLADDRVGAREARRRGLRHRRARVHRRRVRRRRRHGPAQERRGPDRQVRQGARRRPSPTARSRNTRMKWFKIDTTP